MTEVLLRLLRVARGHGVRISAAESLDAFRVAKTVGWSDRALLRDALGVAVAKSADEKTVFAECFDRYFSRQPIVVPLAAVAQSDGTGSSLARMLLDRDEAGLTAALERAGDAIGASGITLFTQTNLFARRILDQMGLGALERDIAIADADTAAGLERGRAALAIQARDFMERQLALFGAEATQAAREHALRRVPLSQIDRRDIARMRVLIARLARRLATRHSRRRYRADRGRLDTRRTLRGNAGTDGLAFHLHWKRHRIDRPKILVLCDVSGSVAAVARFLLFFLYALTDVLHGIRSFAFCSDAVEVSHFLAGPDIENAITDILDRVGHGSSDYGRALESFWSAALPAIDRKTTVIILGDARGNRAPPCVEILEQIGQRAAGVVWLNPEPRPLWGSGDSDMLRYAPFCQLAMSCGNVMQLERAVESVLRQAF